MVANFDTQTYNGMPISEAIARFRAAHNMTQGEFADACGLAKMTVCLIENGKGGRGGKGSVSILTWGKIVKVLDSDNKQ